MRTSYFSALSLLVVSSVVACSSGPEALPSLSADGGPAPIGSNAPPASSGPGALQPGPQGKPAEPPAPPPKADEITEAFGVFVSTAGAAGATGSRSQPLASLTEAIAMAKAAKKRVFVCDGTYEETLELANGVSIVGGLDCSAPTAWKLTDKRSVLKAPSSPAVHAENITVPTRIDNFDIEAPDATAASGSSIGVIAVDSNALTFAKGFIKAGVGMKGVDGVEGEQLAIRFDRTATAGLAARTCVDPVTQTCTNVPQPGGTGAVTSCLKPNGEVAFVSTGGAGGLAGVVSRTRPMHAWHVVASADPVGASGAPAVGGADGQEGRSAVEGKISPDGYESADGVPGTSGSPGQGGRGGDASKPPGDAVGTWWGQSGAGGGSGGCPGLAGTAGKGGGASIAIVAVRSPVRVESMALTASSGGAGGQGTFGSQRNEGGLPGAFPVLNDDTRPSFGSPGGRAGISGNGAGGPSIGIAYQGGAPILTQTNTKVGAGGAGVAARSQNGKTIPAAPAGASEAVKAL